MIKNTAASHAAVCLLAAVGTLCSLSAGQPYTEEVPQFNRLKSHVMIRKIERPTLANLDFAAYDRNPVLLDPPPSKSGRRHDPLTNDEMTFGGLVASPKQSLDETPLTDTEKQQPLAWKPLMKKLWSVVKDDRLSAAGDRIAAKKWSEDAAYQPYQEVTTAYLHDAAGKPEFWVKIECAPWSALFKTISDEDGDGVRELYGKLDVSMPADSLEKAVRWIRDIYCGKLLTRTEVQDWVTDLASYWYPTRNTDILDLGSEARWPDRSVKKQIRRETGNIVVEKPFAVVEGKPFSPDKPIYNVYIVPFSVDSTVSAVMPAAASGATKATGGVDSERSEAFIINQKRFSAEIATYGPFQKWVEKNGSFYTALHDWVTTFPEEQMGLPGVDGWIFFRKSFEALFGGDVTLQPDSVNPLTHIAAFRNFLAGQGIDLLFVAVPDKEEIYFAGTGVGMHPVVPIIKPYGRKFFSALQEQGVEVVDLLTPFLAAASKDSVSSEAVYQKQDTHWTTRGMQIAADLIADRIREYPWMRTITDTIAYRFADTTIERSGDLVERLPPEKQNGYKPVAMPARRVMLPDGSAYRGNLPDAPIVLIGDSFTGVFESIDCKSAGVGSHIAARTRVPVDIITSWGGGPMVRQKMLRARGRVLDRKRIVIYMMVSRDLYNYAQGWEPLVPLAPVEE